MARRSDHTREELLEMAVVAGTQLIVEKGFSNFSARAVASSMGYTVGTLYHLFGTVDDLILHINARTLDDLHGYLTVSLTSARGKRKPVHAMAEAQIEYCRRDFNRWSALYEHRLPPGREIPEWYLPKMSRLFDLVEEALLAHTPGRRKRARRAAKLLWAGLHGLCSLAISGKLEVVGAEPLELLAEELVESVLYGLQR
jgi:AcrR family transcriptional regulator